MPTTDARAVHAAGAVLWRPGPAGADRPDDCGVAVVHRPHHGDWSLPKGKVDAGETRAATAVREIAEETGYATALGRHLATVRYPVGPDRKVVDYWAARAGEGRFVPNGETDELRWLPPHEAAALLTYDSDREVLAEFRAAPPRLATVLLVRHAKAGRRADWDGPDDERPLVDDGRRQALRLADMLELFGVGALHTVPKARCRQTLEALAERRGLTVADEPVFADDALGSDPAAALARLAAIAAGPAVAAVCAQGDGIPALVRDLAGESGVRRKGGRAVRSNRRLASPPSRKGSVWVLSFRPAQGDSGPGLVAADYYRDATT